MRHALNATADAILQPLPISWPIWQGVPAIAPAETPEHWLGGSGDWNEASLWSGGVVPGAQSTAVIARGGPGYTVSLGSDSAVDVLRLRSASATLDLNANLQIGALIEVKQGNLELGAKLSGGRLNISSGATAYSNGGTLADIHLDGSLTVGILELDAGVRFGERGSSAGATLAITGTLELDGTNKLENVTLDLGGAIMRDSADPAIGPIIIARDTIVNQTAQFGQIGNLSEKPDRVVNQGTINAGYSHGVLMVSASSFVNDGQINLSNNNVLYLVGDATGAQIARIVNGVTYDGGGVAIAGNITGGTVDANLFGGGGTLTNVHYEGTMTLATYPPIATGLVIAGSTSFAGTDGVGAATVDMTGGGLYFDNGTTLANVDVTIQSGTIGTDDAQSAAATMTIASSATITITGSAYLETGTSDMIVNHGTVDITDGGALNVDVNMLTNHGTISLESGGQLILRGSTDFGTFSGLGVNQFIHNLSNDGGAIAINGEMDGGTLNTTLTQAESTGYLTDVTFEGTIDIFGQGPLGGYLGLDAGTTLAGANGVGRATINVANGSLDVDATATGIDNANISLGDRGMIYTNVSAIFGPSLLISQTGTVASINGTQTITNDGTIDLAVADGLFTLANVGKLVNNATITLANGEELQTLPGAKSPKPIINEATLSITSGGTIVLQETALSNDASGTMTIANTNSSVTSIMGDNQSSFANAGMLTIGGGGNTSFALATTNTGTISAAAGTLQFLGTTANTGLISEAGGTAIFTDAISGQGTLDADQAGTFSLLAGAASGQTVEFAGTNSLLDLTSPLAFLGTITNFGAGNTIDLINTAETGYSFAAGVLTVTDSGATVASLHFSGSYSTADFTLKSDNHGGSLITFS